VLGAPQRAVVRLPGALAHVVADGPAEHVIERLLLRDVAAALAEHRNQFALVLKLFAGIARLHDILAVRDQRIVGAIADVGARRIRRLGAALRSLNRRAPTSAIAQTMRCSRTAR